MPAAAIFAHLLGEHFSSAQAGKLVLLISSALLLYYIFWILILPFMLIDEGNLIHSFFPPLEYAFLFPAAFGLCFIGGISLFTLYQLYNSKPQQHTFCLKPTQIKQQH